jgi:hypothetical protein
MGTYRKDRTVLRVIITSLFMLDPSVQGSMPPEPFLPP